MDVDDRERLFELMQQSATKAMSHCFLIIFKGQNNGS